MEISSVKKIIREFARYLIVGGISFTTDYLSLVILYEYIIPKSVNSLYVSNIGGFIVGIIINYILSVKFVFIDVKNKKRGKSNRDKGIFILIGIIGLGINEIGMYMGVEKLLISYRLVKIVVAGIVLIWNYLARKKFVFSIEQEQIKSKKGII